MVLYKYFPPERASDVFDKLQLRFSQPAVYNDPFELRPIPVSEITADEFNIILPILTQHHGGSTLEVARIASITYADFLKDPTEIMDLILSVFATGSLVLSLTKVPNDLLMWAHYAKFHKGFVVGFDVVHFSRARMEVISLAR